jgi:peptide/nickel transport system substrate-binding protein
MKAIASALLLPALCAACLASDTGTFITADADRVYTLDPAAIHDRQSLGAALNIYEPLVVYNKEGRDPEFLPFLSTEVPTLKNGLLSKDGRTYSFPIRKGVRFHDGSELTPEDVRYSLLRFLLQDREGGASGILLKPILGVYSTRENGALAVSFEDAASAVRVEEGKVVVRLKEPFRPFLDILASWPFVMSKRWAAAQGDWDGGSTTWRAFNNPDYTKAPLRFKANGTGPFMLDEGAPSMKTCVMLKRHEGYWRGPAVLRRIMFHQVDSELVRLGMIQDGEADAAAVSRSSLRDLEGDAGVSILDDEPGSTVGPILVFTFKADGKDNPALGSGRLDGKGVPEDFFSDPDVRAGFAQAFDYDLFLRQALRGKGRRSEGPLAMDELGYRDGPPPFAFDLEKAAASFRKAFGGRVWEKGFAVEIAYNANDPVDSALVEILDSGLKAVRPSFVLLRKPVWKSVLQRDSLRRRLPVFVASYDPEYPDAHAYAFSLMHGEGLFPKAQGYSNPRADALIEQAMHSSDEAERGRLYERIQEIYKADLPQVFFFDPVDFKVTRSGISGVHRGKDLLDPFSLHNLIYFYRVRK